MVTNAPGGRASQGAPAGSGEESAFAEAAGRYRRELHVHCYRMLGNFEQAEELVQETLLRAWQAHGSFGRDSPTANVRAWLYRIATNACLDELRRSSRRVVTFGSYAEVPWLQPYPDRLLDEQAAAGGDPEARVVARETIELAYIAVIQLLPPKQRAVLVLRDVLGWPAADTAGALGTSVAAVNSALQRARDRLRGARPGHDRPGLAAWQPTETERRLLAAFIDSHERGDYRAAIALMHEDIRVTMPPHPMCFDGREAMRPLLDQAFGAGAMGEWKLRPAWANRQPGAISYLRRPSDAAFLPFKVDVLRVADGKIREITTFDARLADAFGMPGVIPAPRG